MTVAGFFEGGSSDKLVMGTSTKDHSHDFGGELDLEADLEVFNIGENSNHHKLTRQSS